MPSTTITDRTVQIPHYEWEYVSAGKGTFGFGDDNPPEKRLYKEAYIHSLGLCSDGCVSVSVRGDSMSPQINDGDVVLVNTRHRSISNGRIYVVIYDSAYMVKRVYKYSNHIELHSENPSYLPIHITRKQIKTYGFRVIGYVVDIQKSYGVV